MPSLDSIRLALTHNGRIAAALLRMIGDTGDIARRARVLRAAGHEGGVLGQGQHWLDAPHLDAMLRAAQLDGRQARRVGQALVRAEGLGLALCYSGLATPEKAYRRADHLLARECEGDRYVPGEIKDGFGRIQFHPANTGHAGAGAIEAETGRALCGVREGMLEAIPLLFGLVPARVRETQCAYAGADACTFEVHFSRATRAGLFLGLAGGVALAAAAGAAMLVGGLPVWSALVVGFGLTLIAAAAGRSIDLARQLEAVAGARRGHLALLDQLDTSLAEKMDQLAKLGAGAEALAGPPGGEAFDSMQGLVPVSRENVARAGAGSAETGGTEHTRVACDLGPIVEDAIAALRPELGSEVGIDLSLEPEVPRVQGDAFQLAYLVEQLVRNAAQALSPGGRIRVALGTTPTGAALSVEDDGAGIEPDTVDEVFDPFFQGPPVGEAAGMGLPVCYRIVEQHGGELQVQSAEGSGTRVFVVLPSMA